MKLVSRLAIFVLVFVSVLSPQMPMPVAAAGSAPILLIVSSQASSPYGPYMGEIMAAEGINEFTTINIASLDAATLNAASLAVLSEMTLTSAQATLLNNYIAGGGKLVAMRPDAQLATALGITRRGTTTSEGYIAIDNTNPSGVGFTTTTLPFHGTADNYQLGSGSSAVATIYSNQTTATAYPAVVKHGNTVAWAYDLARSMVYTRQGNPANGGIERDGLAPIRTVDVFYHAIDLDRMALPYADIQMRLFSRLITDLLAPQFPLPRMWYLPNGYRTVMVITGDAHGGTDAAFQNYISEVESYGGRASLYLTRYGQYPTAAEVSAWRANGHEFGVHPYGYADNQTLTQGYQQGFDYFASMGYGTPNRTVRNHTLEWQGWVDAAKIEQNFGIALDTDYYSWGPAVTYADGHQAHGYINGSALPMRFVDASGQIIPVYQQETSLVDEQLVYGDYSEHLTTDQAMAVTRALVDASQTGDYGVIMTQFHVDYYTFGEVQPWEEQTMAYARSLGIPMWTAEHLLNYTEARAQTSISGIQWLAGSNQLSFNISVPSGSEGQSVLLPANQAGQAPVNAIVDGSVKGVDLRTITGRQTGFLNNVGPGTHTVVVNYGTAPTGTPTPTPLVTPTSPATATATRTATATTVPATNTPTATPTVPAGNTATPTVAAATSTATATSTPAGPTATATATSTPSPLNMTQTTLADFGAACAVLSNAYVSDMGGGAVTLAANFLDGFSGPLLDTRWTSGVWGTGSYTPVFSNGQIVLSGSAGAWVRSQGTYASGRTLEGVVAFGAGPWQHFGFGDLGFNNGSYLLFSTFNTADHLYARSSNGWAETRTDLGLLSQYAGLHHYRIVWQPLGTGQDQVAYYIDGTLVATHTVGSEPALYVYLSHNSQGTYPALNVDAASLAPTYVSAGTYTSCVLDAGAGNAWQSLSWSQSVPANTGVTVQVRTSSDNVTWGTWSALAGSGSTLSAPGRYAQYQLALQTSDGQSAPLVDAVTVSGAPVGGATATATATAVPATNTPTSTPTVAAATSTATATPTVPASNTAMPTATATAVPATNTPTSTPTVAAATSTPTNTPTLALAISTNTATATRTPTRTATPTRTPRRTATPTRTPTPALV